MILDNFIFGISDFKPKLKHYKHYEDLGCSIHRLSIFSTRHYAFIEEFDVGDEVYWFGHDNVYGFMNKQKYIATQNMVNRIGNSVGPFRRLVAECRKYDENGKLLR